MPIAVSSWRDAMKRDTHHESDASASQRGAQSEPGEAKIASTPIARRPRRIACEPVMPVLVSNVQLGKKFRVARILGLNVIGELLRRHRLREVHRERPEAL